MTFSSSSTSTIAPGTVSAVATATATSRLRPLLSAALLACGLFGGQANAQIPTTDIANLLQSALSALDQITAMKSQLDQAVSQYKAVTGSRGLGLVDSDVGLQNYLPPDWMASYAALQNGTAGMTTQAQALRRAHQIYNCEDRSGADKTLCLGQLNRPYQDKALGLQAYAHALDEVRQITALMGQINQTQDAKGVAEIQARIGAEQATMQNEMNKLALFAKLSETEDRIEAAQRQEINLLRASRTQRAADSWTSIDFH